MKYSFAEFVFEVPESQYKRFYVFSEDYKVNRDKADYTIRVNEDDIDYELSTAEVNFRGYGHFTAVQRKMADWLPLHGAFVLHSAAIDVEGTGVAFAAHSGTGKSTHMLRWQEFLGDKMTVVNGDKPIVRFFEDEPETPYIYGTPWMGKENLGCNMRTQLKHICFIERSDTNFTEKAPKEKVIDRILNQVYMPKNPTAAMNTIGLIDRLLSNCELWIIHCNMDMDAGEKAYKTIFNK